MTTTTATPSALFTEEELNTIFGEISWENDGAPAIITLTIRCDYWILQY